MARDYTNALCWSKLFAYTRAMPRPLVLLFALVLAPLAFAQPEPRLRSQISASTWVEPGVPFPIRVDYVNPSGNAVPNVTLLVTLPDEVEIHSAPPECSANERGLTCSLGTLPVRDPGGAWRNLQIEAIAPQWKRGFQRIAAEFLVDGRRDAFATAFFSIFRAFVVTSAADSGEGSLRQAIELANAECGNDMECRIDFAIVSPQKWVTIRPETPLPAVTARRIMIDGRSQTRVAGDTNPDGPEIELNGSLVADGNGNGLELLSPCSASVRSLAINGWPNVGIVMKRGGTCVGEQSLAARWIADSYIGTDPTGMTAVPNLRGIYTDIGGSIDGNVISGNRRAGVFFDAGSGGVTRNKIGVTARGDQPLGNGAAGIFFGPRVYGPDANSNVVAFNQHAGIAIARGAHLVALDGNSIHGNDGLGVDRHLDGVSVSAEVLRPTITFVAYDATANVTRIEGTHDDPPALFGHSVSLYANDAPDPSGYGEGQYALGGARIWHATQFSIEVPGDLRGKWVTATVTRIDYNGFARRRVEPTGFTHGFLTATSEFSRAVEVK